MGTNTGGSDVGSTDGTLYPPGSLQDVTSLGYLPTQLLSAGLCAQTESERTVNQSWNERLEIKDQWNSAVKPHDAPRWCSSFESTGRQCDNSDVAQLWTVGSRAACSDSEVTEQKTAQRQF